MANPPRRGPGGPPHGGPRGPQKPKNLKKTIGTLLGYIGRSRYLLIFVALCVVLNSLCSILGSYLLKPLINDCIVPGDYDRLVRTLVLMALVGDEAKAGYRTVRGTASVRAEDGANFFAEDPAGLHCYVVKEKENAFYQQWIDQLIG